MESPVSINHDDSDVYTSIQLEHVAVQREGKEIVRDISFSLQPQEFMSIIGPSGSGKSTLLESIAGLIPTSHGKIFVAGQDVTEIYAPKRNIGLVFQNYLLFPHLSVIENIAFGLKIQGWSKKKRIEQAKSYIQYFELSECENSDIGRISGGQAQRVALARALIVQPPVLLLDEPFQALDRVLHAKLITGLRAQCKKQRCTVIMVTHDLDDALGNTDVLAVFVAGEIIQIGQPQQVWSNPTDPIVARLLKKNNNQH